MLQTLAALLVLVYSFTYTRIPEDLLGVDVPIQFLFGALSLVALAFNFLFGERIKLSSIARAYLGAAALFLIYLLADLLFRWISSQGRLFSGYFSLELFAIDFLKYVSCFSSGFAVYLALRRSARFFSLLQKFLMASGILCIATSYVLLALYALGYQDKSSFLAYTYQNSYVGVWPANGLENLPRISGPSLEPQQFSVVFLTPLLLMLSPRHIGFLWPFAIFGILALVLSQSKFIVVSFFLIALYMFIVYKRWRIALGFIASFVTPIFLFAISFLPVFSQTLEEGTETGAIVERLTNLNYLIYLIFTSFWNGVGPGQFATSINDTLQLDLLPKNYIPNLDYLKIFAETGVIGFLLTIFLIWRVIGGAIARRKQVVLEEKAEYYAFLIGSFGLLLNMLFAYQLLQNLFWINAGFLMYLAESSGETATKSNESTEIQAEIVTAQE